ncbi:MAG: hypothetical protein O9350_04650 [Microcystis sp. LE19-388.1G]|nr:hypothetical protein [Microcystis sp. LE19-388.1G]
MGDTVGCGEVGKWGSGEVGKWGSGEVGKWGVGSLNQRKIQSAKVAACPQ